MPRSNGYGRCRVCHNARVTAAYSSGASYALRARERQVLSGARVAASRRARANRKAYELSLFADSPDKRVPINDVRTAVIMSDLQIPFEDPEAVNAVLGVIERVRTDLVVLNGDIVDCYMESDFLKNPAKARAVIPETHARVRALLKALQPVPRRIWLGGNHEDRWRRMLWQPQLAPEARMALTAHQEAAGLVGVDLVDPVASFRSLFALEQYGVEYYPYPSRLYLAQGNLIVTHGRYVSRHAGQSAKRHFEWLGRSCIVGHTHRIGVYVVTQDGVTHGAWELGCLCHLEPEYDDSPNWQQGFAIVRINGPLFHVIQVPIVRSSNGRAQAVYIAEAA